MKVRARFILTSACLVLVATTLIAGCLGMGGEWTGQPIWSGKGDVTSAATAQHVLEGFLMDWAAEDYPSMYASLTRLSRDAITLEEFTRTYENFAQTLTLESIQTQVLSTLAEANHAEAAYRVSYHTRLFETLSRDTAATLTREPDGWRIQWETGMLLPDLRGGNRLDFVSQLPSRGRIFDRSGAPLAAYENALAIGVVPGEILPEQAPDLFAALAEISIYSPDSLARLVETTPDDWYLPVVSLSQAAAAPYLEYLQSFNGVRISEFRSRFYVDGGVAPHALGYMLYIPEEQLDDYLRRGYRQDERIGAYGLEAAFETELAGVHGGSVYIISPSGKIVSLLAASEPSPGLSITTTLDKTLQAHLQASLGDLRAAVVVIEADSGRVLALVSNPHFNPNAFDLTEIDRSVLESYFSDPAQPLFNRATQGQYPLGSIFKVISMSAALESGLYRPNSRFFCGQSMWVCNSVTLYDWTINYGLASGDLSLVEGLMRSCNPWFYHIGESLYNDDQDGFLSEMAYGFGLGALTGIEIAEAPGNIPPVAGSCLNSAQISIGQGEVLVTPLQVAAFFAALANGGNLYRPALVESLSTVTGEKAYTFTPDLQGELPISEETLAALAEGLRLVVEEQRGTAYWTLQGLEIPVSGKTGTAETPSGTSHALFAGYTRVNDPDRPNIAVVVLLENAGEGSVMAAPVFRRAVTLYFSDGEDPGGIMPWESEPYVLYLPEPEPAEESTTGE
ncbi:MAG TPA: penicillin-binding transpeptidase domain-containing protein [Brevefilum sp.]|nr:penicillin-binding transpeptidase domain-containing protein [Brevefilum sp.]HOR18665.1 penicillin-binding transpeptidase domain-containing protein [Brevefilum sp.]HPL68566.1 penicillin-binding transpeptidase domain-containing protein [Brevefilum sp.]